MLTLGTTSIGWNRLGFAALVLVGCNSTGLVGEAPAENTDTPDAPPAPFAPAAQTMVRLTESQYRNTLRDVLGFQFGGETAGDDNTRASGFATIESSIATVNSQVTTRYANAAMAASVEMVTRLREPGLLAGVPCEPTSVRDEACFSMLAEQLGRRLWRRTLSQEESLQLTDLAVEAAEALEDPYAGVQYQLVSLLQAASFVYRVAAGEPTPDGGLRYSSLEMASRLSYFLWDSAPDDELLLAAERGELVDDAALAEHVNRMLADERAKTGVRRFFSELFGLDGLAAAIRDKNPELYPYVLGEALATSAAEETLRVVEHNIFDERGDIRDIYTTRTTFLNRTLASVYSVRAPTPEGFGAFTFPASSGRSGVLTHTSLMALQSRRNVTSATLRGAFVRARVLCTQIPEPPASVDTSFPEVSRATTLRERLEEHRVNPVCASCHSQTDPIGLGLENFDPIGGFRSNEEGISIDASGDLDGEPFEDSAQLGQRIHDHPDVPRCLIKQLYQVATGHFVEAGEEQQLEELYVSFAGSGYRYLDLARAITLSPGFRTLSAAE